MPRKHHSLSLSPLRWFVIALLVSNVAGILMLVVRVLATGSYSYWYLPGNLFLAWVPVVFAAWLAFRLRKNRWLGWLSLLITAGWLAFLPNSFYILTDLIHLRWTGEIDLLFDVVLLGWFIMNGFIAGFIALTIVHRLFVHRIGALRSSLMVGSVLLLSGFAIYLGRVPRWNSWDLLINPIGVLKDVLQIVMTPTRAQGALLVTLLFFLVSGSLYLVVWTGLTFVQSNLVRRTESRAKKQG